MTDNTKLIEKIQKLLALAERGGTEAEADAAMAKVQQLLTEHNLSMGDVVQAQDKDEAFEKQSVTFDWNQSWISVVYFAVCRLYFCDMWNEKNGTVDRKVVIIGKPVNVMSAMYVARIVVENGKKLAREYAQHAYREYGMNAVSASNNFKKGYANRISVRCAELRMAAKNGDLKSETGTALVLADFYEQNLKALDVWREQELGVKLVSGKGMAAPRDSDAAGAGKAAADKQNLTANGIGSNGEKTLLIGGK